MTRILITGSRHWPVLAGHLDVLGVALYEAVAAATTRGELWGRGVVLVHGGCPTGADAHADRLWRAWMTNFPYMIEPEVHRADWSRHGRRAGPIRNAEMVRLGADVCLAFPFGASPGTRGCIALAEAAGIPVRVTEGADRT